MFFRFSTLQKLKTSIRIFDLQYINERIYLVTKETIRPTKIVTYFFPVQGLTTCIAAITCSRNQASNVKPILRISTIQLAYDS